MATWKDGKPSPVTSNDFQRFNNGNNCNKLARDNRIQETNTLEFEEKWYKYEDSREYPRKEREQGLIVIFNQIEFDDMDMYKRVGSEVDEKRLIRSLNRIYFNINPKYIFRNLTRSEIKNEIEKICNEKHSVNCLICIMMTHGSSKNVLHMKDGSITEQEIYKEFYKCNSFKNIPKLFVFQACKTSKSDEPQTVDNYKQTNLVHDDTWKYQIPPHTLLFYSSLEGEVSFRNETEGSWFIQELCNNIDSYGREEDMHSLATRVIKCVACNYYCEKENEMKKQMPILLSTLNKKFYLTMSKGRQNKLMNLEKIRNIQKIL